MDKIINISALISVVTILMTLTFAHIHVYITSINENYFVYLPLCVFGMSSIIYVVGVFIKSFYNKNGE